MVTQGGIGWETSKLVVFIYFFYNFNYSSRSLNNPLGNLPIVLRNAFRLDPKGDFEAQ
jgi:hypothetical protein